MRNQLRHQQQTALLTGIVVFVAFASPSAARDRVYVAKTSAGEIAVIDPTTGTQDTIFLGDANRFETPAIGVFPSSDGKRAIVLRRSTRISIVDLKTGAVRGEVEVPTSPTDAAFLRGSRTAFVANGCGIDVIDTEDARIEQRVFLPGAPSSLQLFTADKVLYAAAVSGWGNDRVSEWDSSTSSYLYRLDSDRRVTRMDLGDLITSIAVTRQGRTLLVALRNGGIVDIDVAHNRIARRIPTRRDLDQLVCAPDGETAYARHGKSGTVFKFDLGTGQIVASQSVPRSAPMSRLSLSADGQRLYVATDTALVFLDAHTLTPVATHSVGDPASVVGISPDEQLLFALRFVPGTRGWPEYSLSVIEAATGSLVETIDHVHSFRAVTIDPATGDVYIVTESGFAILDPKTRETRGPVAWRGSVGNRMLGPRLVASTAARTLFALAAGVVHSIDTTTNRIVTTLGPDFGDPILSDPIDLTVSADGSRLFVLFGSDAVGVFEGGRLIASYRPYQQRKNREPPVRIFGAHPGGIWLVGADRGESPHFVLVDPLDGTEIERRAAYSYSGSLAFAAGPGGSLYTEGYKSVRILSPDLPERSVEVAALGIDAIAASDDPRRVVVALRGDTNIDDVAELGLSFSGSMLAVIDPLRAAIENTIQVPSPAFVGDIGDVALGGNARTAYVAQPEGGTLAIVDLDRGELASRIALGDFLGEVEAVSVSDDVPALAHALADSTWTPAPFAHTMLGVYEWYTGVLVIGGLPGATGSSHIVPGSSPSAEVADAVLHPSGNPVYVALNDFDADDEPLEFIRAVDLSGHADPVDVRLPERAYSLAITPDAALLFAAFVGGRLAIIDLVENRIASVLDVGVPIRTMAVSSDGAHLFLLSARDHGLIGVIVDTRDGRVSAPIELELQTFSEVVVARPGTNLFYVFGRTGSDGVLSIVDADANELVENIVLPEVASDVEIAANGDAFLLFDSCSAQIYSFNVDSGEIHAPLSTGYGVMAIALSPDGRFIYTAMPEHVEVLDVDTGYRVAQEGIPPSPDRITVSCGGSTCPPLPSPIHRIDPSLYPTPGPTAPPTPWVPLPPIPHPPRRLSIAPVSARAGELTELTVEIQPSGHVAEVEADLYFGGEFIVPPAIGGTPDCEPLRDVYGTEGEFSYLPADCAVERGDCLGIHARLYSLGFGITFPNSAPPHEIVRCRLYVPPNTEPAVYPVRLLNAVSMAWGPRSMPTLDSTITVLERDGARPPEPSPRPTLQIDGGECPVGEEFGASLCVSAATVLPGEEARFDVTLHTSDQAVAAVQFDLKYPLNGEGHSLVEGRGHCRVDRDLGRDGPTNSLPLGCGGVTACDSLRALVIDHDNVDPIPDGATLFHCEMNISAEAKAGVYPLDLTDLVAADRNGRKLPIVAPQSTLVIVNPPSASQVGIHDGAARADPANGCRVARDSGRQGLGWLVPFVLFVLILRWPAVGRRR